ncbi:UNVERIFIED_CONTAM: hypothetical protein HDU68_004022 [Siphonaria sp. JEL0065]|nr:hypothetical protein HDU68_004022 [Siphonaria sp. JEL0065]
MATGSNDEMSVLQTHKSRILKESQTTAVSSSFVVIGQTLHKLYYEDKLMKTQKEFLEWTKANLGFSKSTTYEYIISYRVYMEIANKIPTGFHPPMYQSHCQLLSKVPQKKLVETWLDVCRQAPQGVITTAFLELYLDKNNLRSKSGRVSIQATESQQAPSTAAAEPEQETKVKQQPYDQDDNDNHSNNHNNNNSNGGTIMMDHSSSSNSSSAMNLDHTHSSTYQQNASTSSPNNNTLPFNEHLIFELSKQVVLGNQFDMVLQSVEDFQQAENKMWAGRIWSNLASVRPLTTRDVYSVPPALGDVAVFEGGLEHLLRIIFTKFAANEFAEGVFLLRAEFGADWFSPILQHPYCILRHTNPPAPIEIPISAPQPIQPVAEPAAPSPPPPSTSTSKRSKRTTLTSSASLPEHSMMMDLKINTNSNNHSQQPQTANVQPPFESFVMFYLGPHVKEFCSVFRSLALVPGVNSWSAIVGAPSVVLAVGNRAGLSLEDHDG